MNERTRLKAWLLLLVITSAVFGAGLMLAVITMPILHGCQP
jgi:hypothetical protein